jgi:hypothetical protein
MLGPARIVPRLGTVWQGSWASSFAWLGGRWAGDGILDESFVPVMPDHVVGGFAPTSFPDNVLAGLCVGWVHKPVALAGRAHLGRGIILLSTFRIAAAGSKDPVAAWLLETLLAGAI